MEKGGKRAAFIPTTFKDIMGGGGKRNSKNVKEETLHGGLREIRIGGSNGGKNSSKR